MADINDASSLQLKLEQEQQALDRDHDNDKHATSDYDAISAYITHRANDLKVSSVGTYLSYLRHSANRTDEALVEYTSTNDVDALLDVHEEHGVEAASTINGYVAALRGFYEWLDGHEEYGRYRFWDRIRQRKPDTDTGSNSPLVDPEFVLDESEVADIRRAAKPREATLVEFLADTGARISLALQLKCGAIETPREAPGTYTPNPDGLGQKGVPVERYRLHESQAQLRQWLAEHHPEAPAPHEEAPVFPVKGGWYDPGDRSEMAVSGDAARAALRRAAEDAGYDAERVHPHNLRKTAVVRMRVKHDMDWSAIALRAAWNDSSLPQMKEIYRRIDEGDRLAIVDEQLGLDTGEDAGSDVEQVDCVNCGRMVSSLAEVCQFCGASQSPISEERRELLETVRRQLERASVVLEEGTPIRENLLEVKLMVDEKPGQFSDEELHELSTTLAPLLD